MPKTAASRSVEELTEVLLSAPLAWRGAKRPGPAAPATLVAVESRLGIRLPTDVRAFYSKMDGTEMLDSDHGLITLWPLERWTWLDQEAPAYAREAPADAIVFADHSLWCWAYAAEFEAGTEGMKVHVVGGRGGPRIAETFTDFLELIVTNSTRLHGDPGWSRDGTGQI